MWFFKWKKEIKIGLVQVRVTIVPSVFNLVLSYENIASAADHCSYRNSESLTKLLLIYSINIVLQSYIIFNERRLTLLIM